MYEATWNANGDTPAGFYNIGPGVEEATILLEASGIIHDVCIPHAAMGMKGIVDVALANSVGDRPKVVDNALYPDPAKEQLWLREAPSGMLDMFFVDASGREVKRQQTSGTPIFVGDLASGACTVRVVDSAGREGFRQRIHIE